MGTVKKKKIIKKLFLSCLSALIIIPIILEIFAFGAYKDTPFGSRLIDYCFGVSQNDGDFVEFLDIGQGDCTIIKSGNSAVLIDFGIKYDNDLLYTTLLKRGIKSVDLAVITHHHNDHMGEFLNLAEKMKIKRLIINNSTAEDGEAELYQKIVETANKNGTEIVLPKAGNSFKFGNSELEILSCNTSAVEENNRSIVMMLNICGKKILFTGDAEAEVEEDVFKNRKIKCDILKIGHHGSKTSSDEGLLKAAQPDFAIVSCGYDNLYGHPAKSVIQRAEEQGIKILRTDLDRTIRVSFDMFSDGYKVKTERGEVYDSIR